MEFSKEELAKRAEDILNDPIFQYALQEVETRYLNAWRSTPFNATTEREACWLGVKGLADIKTQLQSMATAPKVEAFNKSLRAKHK